MVRHGRSDLVLVGSEAALGGRVGIWTIFMGQIDNY